MSEEELEEDGIEGVDDEEDDGDDADDLPGDDGDVEDDDDGDSDSAEAAPRSKSKSKSKAVAEEDLPSIEAKQSERDALAKAMEEFLARGGKVQEIDPNVVADPPKKPDSKYGSRPI
jgi:hypothetical protein